MNQHFQTPSTHLTRLYLIPMYRLNIEQRYIAPKSLDYVTSVDLWSDIIAMEYPSPHILPLYIALFMKEKDTVPGHIMYPS